MSLCMILIPVTSGLMVSAGLGAQPGGGSAGAVKLDPREAPYLSNIRQITFERMGLERAGEAYFSPDGKTIIYQAYPAGKSAYQIYTQSLDGGLPKMVSTGKGACTCAFWRPDGKKIIFASTHLDPNVDKPKPPKNDRDYKWEFDPHMDIFQANPDGSDLKRLTTTHGYDAECGYSADGKSIAFTSQRDGDLEIYVMDADGGNPRRITNATGWDGGPFFSPDGQSIIYRADRLQDKNLQLRIVGADGANDRALTDNKVFNWCPFWHPSGRLFVFTRVDHSVRRQGKEPNFDLLLMSVDGKKETRITFDAAFDGLPAFSPDGKKLMWTAMRGGLAHAQVFIADFTLPQGY